MNPEAVFAALEIMIGVFAWLIGTGGWPSKPKDKMAFDKAAKVTYGPRFWKVLAVILVVHGGIKVILAF